MRPSHEQDDTILLSVADVAARWKIHPETVKRRIRSRQLRAFRSGKRLIRIRLSDLLAFEETQSILAEQ